MLSDMHWPPQILCIFSERVHVQKQMSGKGRFAVSVDFLRLTCTNTAGGPELDSPQASGGGGGGLSIASNETIDNLLEAEDESLEKNHLVFTR